MSEKHKTRQQLADDLGISPRTLSRKLQGLRIVLPPGLISPKLYQQVVEKFRD
ncbi:helix-turn-helix domain-containing protein [Dyadobacter psychrophilus]|uniref:helix-turn-helix domain-containing protein n=1 Tax=Dyadobacter psychrophilus TaxID=651661 RepID=UPI0011309E7B